MKIVLLENLGVSPELIEQEAEKLKEMGHTLETVNGRKGEQVQIDALKDADAIILANMPLSPKAVEQAEKLKFIDVAFTGTDHLPMELIREKGIVVSNASGYATEAVAELALAFMLELLRELPEAEALPAQGKDKTGLHGRLLKGKTVGIVGAGEIGKKTAEYAKALGAETLAFNRSKVNSDAIDEQTDLDTLLKQSDIVSLHVPLTEQTRHLIGKDEFSKMKKSAYLLNTSRGPVVDTAALVEALNNNEIAGAAIDVFDQEPPLPKDSLVFDAKHLIMTPHIGFDTEESMILRKDIVFENLMDWLAGHPIRIVK